MHNLKKQSFSPLMSFSSLLMNRGVQIVAQKKIPKTDVLIGKK